jgi:hypothetical protein
MTQIELTEEDIKQDIIYYQARLNRIQDRLDELPARVGSWQENKKIKLDRQRLEAEIRHVRQLIEYAKDALTEMAD